jgi:hypothetical protein
MTCSEQLDSYPIHITTPNFIPRWATLVDSTLRGPDLPEYGPAEILLL